MSITIPYLFYAHHDDHSDSVASEFASEFQVVMWRPGPRSFVPPECGLLPFGVWWLFHVLRIFGNRDYSVLLVYDGDVLVHRSCIFPRYFRFPFMSRRDLQIGDTFTRPDYRGRGVAGQALREVLIRIARDDRILWYVVSEDNIASVRVAEKTGFRLAGVGSRQPRFGLRFLGYYCIDKKLSSDIRPT